MTREEVNRLVDEAMAKFRACYTVGPDGKVDQVLDTEGLHRWSDRHNALCDVLRGAAVLRDVLKECGVYESGEVA